MNPTNRLFHPTHSHFGYQPLIEQDCATEHVGAQTNRKNPYNEPAPLAACRTGDLEWLREQFTQDPSVIHLDYRSGRSGNMLSLLYIAARNGHKDIVGYLLNNGADPQRGCKVIGRFLALSPQGAARHVARDKSIVNMIKTAIKQRSAAISHCSHHSDRPHSEIALVLHPDQNDISAK